MKFLFTLQERKGRGVERYISLYQLCIMKKTVSCSSCHCCTENYHTLNWLKMIYIYHAHSLQVRSLGVTFHLNFLIQELTSCNPGLSRDCGLLWNPTGERPISILLAAAQFWLLICLLVFRQGALSGPCYLALSVCPYTTCQLTSTKPAIKSSLSSACQQCKY